MSLGERWDNLSPSAKRVAVLGGGFLAVVAIAVSTMVVSPPQPHGPQAPPAKDALVRNLLTDADPRGLGMDALANRLERMEKRMGELRNEIEKGARTAATAPSVVPRPPDTGREQVMQHATEVESLRQEVAQLRSALSPAKETQPPPVPQPASPPALPPAQAPGVLSAPPAATKPEAKRYGPAPLEELFARPQVAVPPLGPPLGSSPPPGGVAGNRNLQIRTVAAPEKPRSTTEQAPVKAGEGEVYIPAGGMIRGVFLNGLDMPTGQNARKDPTPALIRVKHQAILPNRVRADVRECFLLVAGFGDLASERAHLRGETFSCIRTDGGVIEIPMDGYAVGEDGKVGVRGRVVSKQGALLAKALQAGFLQSFASLFNVQPAIPVMPVPGGGGSNQMQYQQLFTPQALGGAAAQGVGGAMDRLANYYLDAAEQLYPVIEVDAGRGVEFVMNKGTLLRLAK